jgi:hypothetical protein
VYNALKTQPVARVQYAGGAAALTGVRFVPARSIVVVLTSAGGQLAAVQLDNAQTINKLDVMNVDDGLATLRLPLNKIRISGTPCKINSLSINPNNVVALAMDDGSTRVCKLHNAIVASRPNDATTLMAIAQRST